MRLLVVEDDAPTGDLLAATLRAAGHEVDLADNGLAGRHFIEQQQYQLIILDVMLPGLNGWQLLKLIRQGGDTPVLFLTARDSLEDRLRGLELQADDYLMKPFTPADLLARVQTLLRRTAAGGAEMHRIADLEIDVPRRRVSRGGQRIALGDREFDLLVLLAGRQGQVVSSATIAALLWQTEDVGPIEVAIHRLRAKVDERYPPRLIHGAVGQGYCLQDPATGSSHS
ncbi:response regulator [Pseudomonas sp. HR96]|uniref:response regulator n=1 Tax=Pseudomonas sp. HR96 TaxID=1027966 RepID=UPI002A75752C|nr:response regulator [Pseudomonas sp. HR96]WPP00108.1 response regulator [Pseudomonas sp. HR96]